MKDSVYSKQTVFFKILLFGIVFSVLHIVLERIFAYVTTDVALEALIRPLNIVIILCDAASFFITYALLCVSIHRFGAAESIASMLLTVALSLGKHLGNWMTFLIGENVTSAIDVRLSSLTAASSILIELIQHAVVIVLFLVILPRRRSADPERLATLAAAGVMLAVNIISRVILDIDYGAPTSAAEAWIMVAYYVFDIVLYGAVGYVLMRLISKKEYQKCPSEITE